MFSDNFLNSIITDKNLLSETQTYKGWFYVVVTGILFFFFLKNHLNKLRTIEKELEEHKNNLEKLIEKKTQALDLAIEELHLINNKLSKKNEIINNKNSDLEITLRNLKQTQSQLFQAEKMASLGTLTAGVAHEINNPLNYIMGSYVGLDNYFKKNKLENDELISVLLNSLKTGISKASEIVEGLNQFSRNSTTYDEDCNVHTIIDNCLIMLQYQIRNNINIEKQYTNQDLIIKGNVGKLHQVIINIITNSYQSIEEKGEIKISTIINNNHLNIEIEDNGYGISKENLTKITDPFFTTKKAGMGTGLGLSITYNIIKELNGKLLFESTYGKGTKAIIILPFN
jgi:C4-dicarboxylate-specific signal transduction histidine kinase